MALKRSTGFGLRTLLFKLTTLTRACSSNIFIVLTLFIKPAFFQSLTGRTSKGVSFSVVGKSFLGKDTFFRSGTFLSLL